MGRKSAKPVIWSNEWKGNPNSSSPVYRCIPIPNIRYQYSICNMQYAICNAHHCCVFRFVTVLLLSCVLCSTCSVFSAALALCSATSKRLNDLHSTQATSRRQSQRRREKLLERSFVSAWLSVVVVMVAVDGGGCGGCRWFRLPLIHAISSH